MPRFLDAVTATVLATLSCSSPEAQNSASQAGSSASGRTSQARSSGSASTAPSTAAGPAPAAADAGSPPAPASKPASVLEQVQQGAPAGTKVSAVELKVNGIELFVVSDRASGPGDASAADRLVGVVGGLGGKVLEGNELVRAAIAGKPDAATLARVALRVAQHEGEVLDRPINAEQRKAKVRPPRIAGKALVFWVWTMGVPRMLELGKLDRTTGALDIAVPPALRGAAITTAMIALADANVEIDASAIQMLAAACAEPKVKAALVSALGNHPRTETRAELADVAHKCGPDAIQPLIHTMEHDRAAQVRSRAATALGRIGDGRARPSLGKASKSEDANLAWAAKKALEKLQ